MKIQLVPIDVLQTIGRVGLGLLYPEDPLSHYVSFPAAHVSTCGLNGVCRFDNCTLGRTDCESSS